MAGRNEIKHVQQLHLKKYRDAERSFIAEGVKTVMEIARHRPEIIRTVYALETFIQQHTAVFTPQKINLVPVTEQELGKMSMQQSPNQVLAVCDFFTVEMPAVKSRHCFYLDDIRDPGNLGTIVRLADWFGMLPLYCSPNTCELYNPKVLQASMGSFLRVRLEYILLSDLLKTRQFQNIYGAVLGGNSIYDNSPGDGLIIVGNEANGIHPRNLDLVTSRITIPAAPGNRAESLNAAMSVAIIAGEFFRRTA